jgi:hypothetical protein
VLSKLESPLARLDHTFVSKGFDFRCRKYHCQNKSGHILSFGPPRCGMATILPCALRKRQSTLLLCGSAKGGVKPSRNELRSAVLGDTAGQAGLFLSSPRVVPLCSADLHVEPRSGINLWLPGNSLSYRKHPTTFVRVQTMQARAGTCMPASIRAARKGALAS